MQACDAWLNIVKILDVTVSPQEFPAPMIFASCGDLLLCTQKKAKCA